MSLVLELPVDEGKLARAARLAAAWEGKAPQEILRHAIEDEFIGRIAMVSSFGAESASLLHMVAAIDPALPVIFIDTDKHFAQTLDYKDELAARLGLKDLRVEMPDSTEVKAEDPKGDLWKRDPDACCALRKVRPNERALVDFDAWISGRKRHHGAARAHLPVVDYDGIHFKVNPLVSWTPADIRAYVKAHDLPAHPLVADGYPSIGCWPCTSPAAEDGNARSGRWANQDKTECGIHRPAPQKPQRAF
jgi:phosphoadenosine phosphosulfate reductase